MREEDKVKLDQKTLQRVLDFQDYEQFERAVLDLVGPYYGKGGVGIQVIRVLRHLPMPH